MTILVTGATGKTGSHILRELPAAGEEVRVLTRKPENANVPSGTRVVRGNLSDPEVPDGVELYRSRPNLVVLRTFSKAYGLAALRVGYAVAHEAVAARIRHTVVPFGVNSLAQTAALASLAAEDESLERVEAVVKERDRLTGAPAVPVTPSEANFVWLPLGERTTAFTEACARAGIDVRAFPGAGVRLTVGTPEANDAVLRVAAAFVTR
ncbi:aminotransferase class I/II-fold pyridoxal phosphate-dependent enzyme [Streptomyces sp. NPDC051740]|uniref:aminotransferase class I/II-fold pyridoxal phosphate-dependent enzyme n=1 Tax=Streptomyces sp. NPDC051740 TaxID=3365673 RepID=UPI0037969DD4